MIITGAAGSLGSALSAAAVAAGWNTVMTDNQVNALEQAYDRADEARSGAPSLYPMDLAGAGPEEVDALLDTIASEFGGLDAIVHCAARFECLTPLEHTQPDEWLAHMQVNLNAAWLLSARSLPLLRASDRGRLVFLLEDLDRMDGALWGPYGVSKHALRALVSQLSRECLASGIEVKGVNPGPMSSPLRARAYHSENPSLQPDPGTKAAEIMAYLLGQRQWPDVFVELK